MNYQIPKKIKSKIQILKTVELIPNNLSENDYFNIYKQLFNITYPSGRRIYLYDIFSEKIKLLNSNINLATKVNFFHESYLKLLNSSKEKNKEIKLNKICRNENKSASERDNKISKRKKKINNESRTKKKNILYKHNSNIIPPTREMINDQYDKWLKKLDKTKNISKSESNSKFVSDIYPNKSIRPVNKKKYII